MAIGLPLRKYLDDDDGGPLERPFLFNDIPPSNVTLVFECEDCESKIKDDVSNITYNGAPMCCGAEMLLSHCEVNII